MFLPTRTCLNSPLWSLCATFTVMATYVMSSGTCKCKNSTYKASLFTITIVPLPLLTTIAVDLVPHIRPHITDQRRALRRAIDRNSSTRQLPTSLRLMPLLLSLCPRLSPNSNSYSVHIAGLNTDHRHNCNSRCSSTRKWSHTLLLWLLTGLLSSATHNSSQSSNNTECHSF